MIKKTICTIGFIAVLICTSLPLALPVIMCQELVDVNEVIDAQSTSKAQQLYGVAYYDDRVYYKTEFTKRKSASILALGSSRAMQIRDSFFETPSDFFNAGGAVNYLLDFMNFLNNIEGANPEILIISLDQNFFNFNYSDVVPVNIGYPAYSPIKTDVVINKLIDGYIAEKVKFKPLVTHSNYIGVQAKVNRSGFLNDGSYFYGATYAHPSKYFDDILKRIETGTLKFQYGEEVNPAALAALKDLLVYCKQNDIFVVGFTPPYAPSVNVAMGQNGGYGYMEALPLAAEKLFDTFEFEFYDYSDITMLECDDTYFVDGFHGGDVAYLRMFKDMVNQGSRLSKYCNVKDMEKLNENRWSNLLLENHFAQDEYFK